MQRCRHYIPAVLIGTCVAVGGCSSSEDAETGVPPRDRAHAWVRLVVEIDGGNVKMSGQTRFLRYRDVSGDTAEILAGPIEQPLDPGACEGPTVGDALEATLAGVPERALVTLLDAGELVVQVGEIAGAMSPRRVPALFPYVTGVEYDELQVGSELVPAELADVSVTGFGGVDVGGFDVVATLPPVPGDVTAEIGDRLVATWARPAPGARDDDVTVEVLIQRGLAEWQLRCREPDDGVFTLPRSALDELTAASAGDLVVAVQRSRRVPFRARGIDYGEVEVTVRHVAPALSP